MMGLVNVLLPKEKASLTTYFVGVEIYISNSRSYPLKLLTGASMRLARSELSLVVDLKYFLSCAEIPSTTFASIALALVNKRSPIQV